MDSIITLEAFGDNLIYLYRYSDNNAFAVDPGESSLVMQTLKKHNLNLTAILATHQHWDHTGGISQLKSSTGCKVYGIDKNIPSVDFIVKNGQIIDINNLKIQVIATPGHTAASVCYYLMPDNSNNGVIWTGDTLFVGGCGRIFGADPSIMWNSLCKLAALPDETIVCCGHDYTIENYEFASGIDPDNHAFKDRLQEVRKQGANRGLSTIKQEKETNIFLLADSEKIKNALNMPSSKPADIFGILRRRKDAF